MYALHYYVHMHVCSNTIGVAALQTMVRQDCHRTVFKLILFMLK